MIRGFFLSCWLLALGIHATPPTLLFPSGYCLVMANKPVSVHSMLLKRVLHMWRLLCNLSYVISILLWVLCTRVYTVAAVPVLILLEKPVGRSEQARSERIPVFLDFIFGCCTTTCRAMPCLSSMTTLTPSFSNLYFPNNACKELYTL